MNRKSVRVMIDPNLWIEVRAHCIIKKLNTTQYLEKLISKDLKFKKS